MTLHLTRNATALSIVAILGSGAAFANSLTVESRSGFEGDKVAVVNLDGGTDRAYVVSEHPNDEKKMTMRFLVDPTPIVCDRGERVEILKGTQTAPVKSVIRLVLHCAKNDRRRIYIQAHKTNGNKKQATVRVRAGDEVSVVWCASSGGLANASAQLYINGELKAELLNFRAVLEIDRVIFGATKLFSGGMTGEYYLDDFASFSS